MKQKPQKVLLKSVPPFLKWHAPTKALVQYFDPSKPSPDLELFSSSLNEALRFGTHIMSWYRQEYFDAKFCEVVSGLFSEQLQKIDALAAMFKLGGYSQSPIIMRCMVEIHLQLRYILQKDSDRRALSLKFMGKVRRMEFLKELLNSTSEGKRTRDLLMKDKSEGSSFELGGDSIPEEIDELEKEISSADYLEIAEEYKRLSSSTRKRIEWYRLFDGPTDLRILSERVGETIAYYACYRNFNEYVHGTQRFREEKYFKKQGIVNKFEVRQFDPAPLFNESYFLVSQTFRLMLEHIHIDPEIPRDWMISCKLLKLPGFQNFVVIGRNEKELDLEL